MIDARIAGHLCDEPTRRVGASGRPFAVANVVTHATDGEPVHVGGIVFVASVRASLLALNEGDTVSLSGKLKHEALTDQHGEARPTLDMVAHALLTPYHINHKRKAVSRAA